MLSLYLLLLSVMPAGFVDMLVLVMLVLVDSARAVMEAAEAKMIESPMDQKALDRFLQAQATYEAVGGLTQDRLVAQVTDNVMLQLRLFAAALSPHSSISK